MKLKVLLVGSGGREHAIATKLKQSPLLGELKVYPGNGGFNASELVVEKIDLGNKDEFQQFVKKNRFDLVVVGPEQPLVDGMADWMQEIGIPCFGPSAYCAQIEGSKDFAKKLMVAANVPTASHQTFGDYQKALQYVRSGKFPVVVKADGLAAGKGVTVCLVLQEAEKALQDIFLDKVFGDRALVVIEEFMAGEEASIFALCDGENFILLPAAQDHKRVFDGDLGPNTGGMGAYCPAPVVTQGIVEQVEQEIIKPVLDYFIKKGSPYRGVLYAGLMVENGRARVVEFNCRFGDPETQAVLLMLENDLLEIMLQCSKGGLGNTAVRIYPGAAAVVVLAAEGYPGEYKKNIPLAIQNTEDKNIFLFHAGTRVVDSQIVSSGGRILGVSLLGKDLKDSIDRIYKYMDTWKIPGTFYRKDIGWRAL